ncbi:MAG: hypothetical protein PHF79_01865 [Candidatus Pacebacteria bacterium]|nr:hypothetical protein [Candidatus Paceibacterota bacterium]
MNQTATLQVASLRLNMASVVWSLFALFIVLVAMYGILVRQTVFNVVARQQAENKVADLGSATSDLEYQYISAKNAITLDVAYAHGFKDVTNPTFINRTTLGKASSKSVE